MMWSYGYPPTRPLVGEGRSAKRQNRPLCGHSSDHRADWQIAKAMSSDLLLLKRCDAPLDEHFHHWRGDGIPELLDFVPTVPSHHIVCWKSHRRPDLLPLKH